MRLLASVIILVGVVWAVAIRTVGPAEIGLRLDGGAADDVLPVGSHFVVWPAEDWRTLASGPQLTPLAPFSATTEDGVELEVEAVLIWRFRHESAPLVEMLRAVQVPAEQATSLVREALRASLSLATRAELTDPAGLAEVTAGALGIVDGVPQLRALEVSDLLITRLLVSRAGQPRAEEAGLAAARADLALLTAAP